MSIRSQQKWKKKKELASFCSLVLLPNNYFTIMLKNAWFFDVIAILSLSFFFFLNTVIFQTPLSHANSLKILESYSLSSSAPQILLPFRFFLLTLKHSIFLLSYCKRCFFFPSVLLHHCSFLSTGIGFIRNYPITPWY